MRIRFLLMLIALLAVSYSGLAYNAYVWDNENITNFPDPETGNTVGSDYTISSTLVEIGIDFEMGDNLPNDLSEYDIVFVLLGTFCFG